MEHIFDVWSKLKELILKASHILLMLDYDGTLTPIVERPELAVLSEETKLLLKNISELERYVLCIVSGRELKDIKNLVKIENLVYIGNHGFGAQGKGIEYVNPDALKTAEVIKKIHQELLQETKDIAGVLLEYKRLTEALHYRMVSEAKVKNVKKIFNFVVEPYLKKGIIKIAENKKTLEVLPNVDWHKGKMVQHIMGCIKHKSFLPLYIGDDATDENAFKALRGSGIAVLVSEHAKKSYAHYYVRNVDEVIKFLELLYNAEKRK